MIISLLNQKGGVGKTTLSVHIATAFAQLGKRLLLIDADPQNSSLDWAASRQQQPLFPVMGLPKSNLHRELPFFVQNYDIIVIDGPPRVHDIARSAIIASSLVLIPVQPSPLDIWAAKEIVDLLAEATIFKPELKSAFLINRKVVNTAIGRDVVDTLLEFDLPIFNTSICQRVLFAESIATGQTVLEIAPTSLASQEINSVISEINSFMER